MKIERIWNNNACVVLDEQGKEKILTGRGLVFGKKVGDQVDASQVDKEFLMATPELTSQLKELIQDIPIEYFELGNEIILYTKTHLGKKLNESIYLSLVDHIYTAIIRFKEGIVVKNALLWDIGRFYPDEFVVGQKALDIIEKRCGVRLPKDEAGFIALHVVNAQMDNKVSEVYEITDIMQEITTIVKYTFNVEFDEKSVYFYRFITHLKFFAQRLITRATYDDSHEDDLLDLIKVKYRNAYQCVEKIGEFIFEKYHYVISNEERLYLTIHIERVIYKTDS
ncbi:BglG family transcription antiterminator LicT [uncultured Vagococcus sp.]|uniref:BglG family transcription antiterminator LicT n=1 Tax=uncultured Vagococcus sp. TaxID=189676 RepID=UPI0028D21A14|nr:PRD domain-containing protein [uncultured Vagococcus sp.]